MLLASLAALYEENRFFDAWTESQELFNDRFRDRLAELDAESLVLLGRLARRLGSPARSRLCFYAAKKKSPADPRVRYFAMRSANRSMLHRLFDFERDPRQFAGTGDIEAAWYAEHAVITASLQDFDSANISTSRALELEPADPYVRAMYAMALLSEGKRDAALEQAELAWRASPGRPSSAGALAATLSSLGRAAEAAARLTTFAEQTRQSFEVAMTAASVSIFAATRAGAQAMRETAQRTLQLMPELERLAPIADKSTKRTLAALGLEVARHARELEAAKIYAAAIDSPFSTKLLARIEANPNGTRVVLPYRFSRQGQAECLPASLSACLGVFGVELDHQQLAEKITFGGTAMWRAGEWAESNGYIARFFIAESGAAVKLIEAGLPFVLIIPGLDESHACAIVGVDHATGSLLVHDPNHDGLAELILETLGEADAPFGPRAMVVVRKEDAARLQGIELPYEREEHAAATLERLVEKRSEVASQTAVIEQLKEQGGSLEHVELLKARLAALRGESATATAIVDRLLAAHPKAISLEALRLRVLRAVGNTARLRETLARLVDTSTFESATDRPSWFQGHPLLRVEYAAALASSAEYRPRAERQLESALRADPSLARAYEMFGQLRLAHGDAEGALLPLRIASTLRKSDDSAARSYVQALLAANREHDAIVWLEKRIEYFANHELSAPAWIALIDLYDALGRADETLEQLRAARARLPGDAMIAARAVGLFARYGQLESAHAALADLQAPSLRHSSAIALARIERRYSDARRHAAAWIKEEPRSTAARNTLIELVFDRDGPTAAVRLAESWFAEDKEQEIYELQLLEALKHAGEHQRRIQLLEERIAKNELDAWAHREVAVERLGQARSAPLSKRTEFREIFARALARCQLSSPDHPLTVVLAGELATLERNYQKAREYFGKALELAPEEGRWMVLYADAAKKSGADPTEVIARLEHALLRAPGAKRCFFAAVSAVQASSAPRRARAFVSAWRTRAPDDAEIAVAGVALNKSELAARGGEALRKTTIELERLVARSPAHAGLRRALADLYIANHDRPGALRELAKALELEPDVQSPRIDLAHILLALDRPEDALAELQTLVTVMPMSESPAQLLAKMFSEQQRLEEAIEVLREASRRLPSAVGIVQQLAELLGNSGRPREAAELFDVLLERRPDDAAALVAVAQSLLERNAPDARAEAEKLLLKALALPAPDWDALDALFDFYLRGGQYSEAGALLEQYRDAVDDPSWLIRREASLVRAEKSRLEAVEVLSKYLETRPQDAGAWSIYVSWLSEDSNRSKLEAVVDKIPLISAEHARVVAQGISALISRGLKPGAFDQLWAQLRADGIHTFELELDYCRYLLASERYSEALELAQRLERASIVYLDASRALVIEAFLRLGRGADARALFRVLWGSLSSNTHVVQHVVQLFAAEDRLDEVLRDGWTAINQGRIVSRSTLDGAFDAAVQRRSASSLAAFLGAIAESSRAEQLVPAIAHGVELLLEMKAYGLVLELGRKHQILFDAHTALWMALARARFGGGDKQGTRTHLVKWRLRDQVPMHASLLHALSALELGRYKEAIESCSDGLELVPKDSSMRGLAHLLFLAHLHEQAAPVSTTTLGSRPFLDAWMRFGRLLPVAEGDEDPTPKMFALFAGMLQAVTVAERLAADRAFRRFMMRFRDQCGWARPVFNKWLIPRLPLWRRVLRWFFG